MSAQALCDHLEACSGRPDGPRVWSLFSSESCGVSLGIKDGEIGSVHAPINLTRGSGARYVIVWKDGRVSRGHLERRQLEGPPPEALAWALETAYEDPDAAYVSEPMPIPAVALFDEAAARVADGEVGPLAERVQRMQRHVDREGYRTWSGSLSASRRTAHLRNSNGVDIRSSGTQCGWFVYVNGEFGDGHGARALDDGETIDARLQRLATLAHALGEPAANLRDGVQPILLHPHVVQSYVLGTLLFNLGGAVVAHGEGQFAIEHFGDVDAVLRDDIHLRLDPLTPLQSGSYRFTGEGVAAAHCSFIEGGRLVQPILDLKFARRLGLPPTPQISDGDSLTFGDTAPLDESQAHAAADGGPLVLSVLGVHTQDSASGDFSLSTPQALGLSASGYTGRARGSLSGNLFEILRDPRTRFVRFEGENLPGMLVHCRFDPR